MWWNRQARYSNRPVVGVSWFEADAYGRWLDAQARQTNRIPETLLQKYALRLPTEAEWEKAARYDDGRRYPWGDTKWDEEKANIDASKIGHPNAVGIYPGGVTLLGLHDVAGNVWEWTFSLDKDYPYDPQDGRNDPNAEGSPVVRGGSWGDIEGAARCAFRYGALRGNFYGYLGFRVVLSLVDSGF
jgi:formylglycine-generating enzyme required for sulfatase activity